MLNFSIVKEFEFKNGDKVCDWNNHPFKDTSFQICLILFVENDVIQPVDFKIADSGTLDILLISGNLKYLFLWKGQWSD